MWLLCCSLEIIKAHRLQGMDEFGNRCHEWLKWGWAGRFPWWPCEQEPALPAATNLHCHTEGTSVEILTLNTVLYLGLPSNEGGKGRVVNLPVKQWKEKSNCRWPIRLIHQQMGRQTPTATQHAHLLERPVDALTLGQSINFIAWITFSHI